EGRLQRWTARGSLLSAGNGNDSARRGGPEPGLAWRGLPTLERGEARLVVVRFTARPAAVCTAERAVNRTTTNWACPLVGTWASADLVFIPRGWPPGPS